jgi:hypothetical protein
MLARDHKLLHADIANERARLHFVIWQINRAAGERLLRLKLSRA